MNPLTSQLRTVLIALLIAAGVPAVAQNDPPAATKAADAKKAIATLPGLDEFVLDAVGETREPGVFTVGDPKGPVAITAFQTEVGQSKPWYAALVLKRPDQFRFDRLSRDLAQRVLGKVKPTQVVLVTCDKAGSVPVAKLPRELRGNLGAFAGTDGKVALSDGANLFAALRLGNEGLLGQIKRTLDIDAPVRLNGKIDARILKVAFQDAGGDKQGADKEGADKEGADKEGAEKKDDKKPASKKPTPGAMSLTVIFPESTPVPFGVAGDPDLLDMVCHSTSITISERESTKKGESTLGLAGKQHMSVWVLGRKVEIENSLELKPVKDVYEIAVRGTRRVDWKDAFKLDGLDINEITISGKLTPPTGGTDASGGIGIGAVVALPKHGALSGQFAVTVSNRKITDLRLSLTGQDGGGIDLGALPALRRVPAIEEFRLETVALGLNPSQGEVYVEGKGTWQEKDITGEIALLRRKNAAILFMQVDGLHLRKLLPSLPAKAELIGTDRAMLAVSTADFKDLKAKTLPPTVKTMVERVTGNLDAKLPVFKGLTMFMRLDPASLAPEIRDPLESIGVTEPAVLAGSVGGVVGGTPKLALYADLPTLPVPKRHGKLIKQRATGVGAKLFISSVITGAGPELSVGIEGAVGVMLGREEVEFVGSAFLLVSPLSQGVRLAGVMNGTWDEPFGLVGIAFSDLVIAGGVDVDSSVEIELAGEASIGKLRYEAAGLISLITGSGGFVPKKIGLMFEGSELSQLTQLQIMDAFVKGAVGGPIANAIPDGATKDLVKRAARSDLIGTVEEVVPLPMVKFKDVMVYMVSPGASLPGQDDGEIDGMGVAVKGTMSFMNHDLGRVDNSLTLREGLKIYAAPGEFDIGVASLEKTKIDVRVPMPGVAKALGLDDDKARFVIRGGMSAGCSIIEGDVLIKLNRNVAAFRQHASIAGYGTDLDFSVPLSDWPKFEGRGKGRADMVRDVADSIMSSLEQKAKGARAKAEAFAAKKKAERDARRARLEKAIADGRAAARREAEAAIEQVRAALRQQGDRFKKRPAIHRAFKAAERAAGRMKLARDNTVEGVKEVRAAVQTVVDKGKGEVQSAATAVRQRIDHAIATARSIPDRVAALPAVTKARGAVDAAQAELDDFRTTLMKEKIDPVAAAATDLLNSFEIEQCGLDGGLKSLCSGRPPNLNVVGTFAGKRFDLREGLVLVKKQDFARQNRRALEAVTKKLFASIDSKHVDAAAKRMGAER